MLIEAICRSNFFNVLCNNPFEMLRLDDCTLLGKLDDCKDLVEQLKKRKLLKRGIIISELTVTGGSIGEFEDLRYDQKKKGKIEEEIRSKLGCSENELVVIDIPKKTNTT